MSFSIQYGCREVLPRYYRIKTLFTESIKNGAYKPHQRLPSLKDIALQYSVSSITALRVLRELLRDDAAYSVKGKGCFVSGLARRPQSGRQPGNKIVFIADCFRYNFYMPALKGILDETQKKGFELAVSDSSGNRRRETALLSMCLKSKPAGIIFIPSSARGYGQLLYMEQRSIPAVTIENNISGGSMYMQGNKAARLLINKIESLHSSRRAPDLRRASVAALPAGLIKK